MTLTTPVAALVAPESAAEPVRLVRHDRKHGPVAYDVTRLAGGGVECTCGDACWRRRACKHVRALVEMEIL